MKADDPKLFTPAEAKEKGYLSITEAYGYHSSELRLLAQAIDDCAGCDILLVQISHGIEIWRRSSQVNVDVCAGTSSAGQIKARVGKKATHRLP